jgi:hypothetical protein
LFQLSYLALSVLLDKFQGLVQLALLSCQLLLVFLCRQQLLAGLLRTQALILQVGETLRK